jgi:hypothetical protein
MKKLIVLNERWINSIMTDEEVGLVPKCLATLNDWKVATSELLKQTQNDMIDKISMAEKQLLDHNIGKGLRRMNKTMSE